MLECPRSKVVVAVASGPRLCSPVLEIARRRWIGILVIAQSRFRPVFKAAPRRAIAILEIFRAPFFIRQVACRENRPGNLLDQFGGRPGTFRILATSDVPRSDQDKSQFGQVPLSDLVLLLP